MSKSYCNLLYHLVFSTKDRRPWFDNGVRGRIHEYLGGAIRKQDGIPLCIGGTADHIHLLAKLRQDRAVADVLRNIKAGSSGWLHDTFEELQRFAWQEGYGAFTVSPSQVEKVRRYISAQEEHHEKTSFKEEFTALLEAHGVEYDAKYVWR